MAGGASNDLRPPSVPVLHCVHPIKYLRILHQNYRVSANGL